MVRNGEKGEAEGRDEARLKKMQTQFNSIPLLFIDSICKGTF